MANYLKGFRPAKYLSGAAWNGQVTKYVILAASTTATFIGDVVKLTGAVSTGTIPGAPAGTREIVPAAAGDAAVGAVVGFGFNPLNLNVDGLFRPTGAQSQDRVVYVADDPNILFEAQFTGTFASADIGLNASLSAGAGSTSTGQSAHVIDGATKATTNTLTFKTIDWVQSEDNTPGGAGSALLVKINKHQLTVDTGAAGV